MQALALLIKRHQQQALRLAFRSLGDWHLAEDAVQEAFLRVHRAASKYRPEARFTTWFYRIVVNLCMDELRRRQRRSEGPTAPASVAGSADNPLEQQQVRETRQAVHQALNHLSDRERIAVVLHRFEGQSHRQIAEITETSPAAVESLLVRAYRKLRSELAFLNNSIEKP
jgi:RNA polymerase sigma-70 factor (ECF subfamily)